MCTAPSAEKLMISLIEMCGDSYEIVRHERFVPLVSDTEPFVFPDSVRKNDALIVFSKKSVIQHAEHLKSIGVKASLIYGDLPYDVRRNKVDKFIRGETDVVVATDAIGMGLNLPVQRVVFLEQRKFYGKFTRHINESEAKQIAGRAGRMGKYDIGYYTVAENAAGLRDLVECDFKNINRARLKFPENIIGVDMPLSEILERWKRIPCNEALFKNISVKREVMLCRILEQYSDDKQLIYRFITIPFSERNEQVRSLWLQLFRREQDGLGCPDALLSVDYSCAAELEAAYRKLDLLYYYFTRFHTNKLTEIPNMKRRVSVEIMECMKIKGD